MRRQDRGAMRLKRSKRRRSCSPMQFQRLNAIAFSRCSDLPKGKSRFPQKGTCLSIYSRAVNGQASLGSLLLDSYPWCAQHAANLKRLFGAYVDEKHKQGVVDFDDLLLYWSHLMGDRELGAHVVARFDHVLVDEYQDTNRLQEGILLGLKPMGNGLTVIGDDAQSISTASGRPRSATSSSSRSGSRRRPGS
jgi:superfamily I DNA/RNA helicase